MKTNKLSEQTLDKVLEKYEVGLFIKNIPNFEDPLRAPLNPLLNCGKNMIQPQICLEDTSHQKSKEATTTMLHCVLIMMNSVGFL